MNKIFPNILCLLSFSVLAQESMPASAPAQQVQAPAQQVQAPAQQVQAPAQQVQAPAQQVQAPAPLEMDFDSLGGNKTLMEKARALNPETDVQIVQDRIVSRRNRVEIAPELSGTFGGDDTYTKTTSFGLNAHYHFNPHWSVGLKFNRHFNKLTNEGEAAFEKAWNAYLQHPDDPNFAVPELDYPKEEKMALVDWYPIYGKLNFMDKGIAHFDVYFVGGYGQVELHSGQTGLYTLGSGIGFWWTNKFSSRFELRYESYKAKYQTGETNLDVGVASLQMGWML